MRAYTPSPPRRCAFALLFSGQTSRSWPARQLHVSEEETPAAALACFTAASHDGTNTVANVSFSEDALRMVFLGDVPGMR